MNRSVPETKTQFIKEKRKNPNVIRVWLLNSFFERGYQGTKRNIAKIYSAFSSASGRPVIICI